MASEAQRLIGISLTKIAQSRSHRGGVSLHKNLLVATVLQKARYIFMEEAYSMVHYQAHHQVPTATAVRPASPSSSTTSPSSQNEEDLIVGLTAEEAVVADSESDFAITPQQHPCAKCALNRDKENNPPHYQNGELTYFDLDNKSSNVLKERSNCLKRRRAVAEWETEEAVQSILPKRCKTASTSTTNDDSNNNNNNNNDDVFVDDATFLSNTISRELETERDCSNSAMEIDRITSLVSIFSFSMQQQEQEQQQQQISADNNEKINRSTTDLCSTQAKDVVGDSIQQQRPFLAMTV